MPIYRFVCNTQECPANGALVRRMMPRSSFISPDCIACGFMLERSPAYLGLKVVEVLDNGAMSRRVERPVDINEQVEEHKKRHE